MTAVNHTWFGVVNRKRLGLAVTMQDMDSRALLARNLKTMMERSPDLKSQGALHRRSKVAQSTIDRILGAEVSATLDVLDKLAGAFGLTGWQLIHPKPDIREGEAAFYAKLRTLLDQANGKP